MPRKPIFAAKPMPGGPCCKYDDGGFSGSNTDRPALQRLLEDVRAGRVDVIAVYKVDRLTRSLADFAKLVELFDQHNVSFWQSHGGNLSQPSRNTRASLDEDFVAASADFGQRGKDQQNDGRAQQDR